MNAVLKKLLLRELDALKERIKSDNCNLSAEEGMDIIGVIAHESLSKEQACSYLNVRKSRFGELIDNKKIPKGRKITGFKEHRWYKDDLIRAVYKKKVEENEPSN